MSALRQVTIRLNRRIQIGLRGGGVNLNQGRIFLKHQIKPTANVNPVLSSEPILSRTPHLSHFSLSLSLSLGVKLGAGLSHHGPDGGNLIARQGQDSALSTALRRGSLDVIVKLDRTSFKSMPPRTSGDRQQLELKS